MSRLFKAHRAAPSLKVQPLAPVQPRVTAKPAPKTPPLPEERPKEIGGPEGPEPTRYGDWERKGICYDF